MECYLKVWESNMHDIRIQGCVIGRVINSIFLQYISNLCDDISKNILGRIKKF